jgi:drug/metabolite transporter (DMT)-like permease
MNPRVTLVDWLLLAGLVVCWGSSFVMSKLALQHLEPEWIAASRLCVGAAVLILAAAVTGQRPALNSNALRTYGWLGLIGNAAPFVAVTWGMQFIPSGVAGLLMGTIPLIIIAMAHFTLPGEALTLPRTAGFILGFLGIVVLMGPANLLQIAGHGQELIGQLAVVAGCLMYGVNSISTKKSQLPSSVAVVACVLFAGAVFATVYAAFVSPFTLQQVPSSALWAILGLGLFPTGLATLLWFKLVTRTGPTFTSMSNYLVPVYALCFGAILLGETIGLNVLFATVLVLAGIFVSRFKPPLSR